MNIKTIIIQILSLLNIILDKLVYYENFHSIEEAIDREKQLKKWNRSKKEFLIRTLNPHWNDLSEEVRNW